MRGKTVIYPQYLMFPLSFREKATQVRNGNSNINSLCMTKRKIVYIFISIGLTAFVRDAQRPMHHGTKIPDPSLLRDAQLSMHHGTKII